MKKIFFPGDDQQNKPFSIVDGGKIAVTNEKGITKEFSCNSVDDNHVEIGVRIFHTYEFAERMARKGYRYMPVMEV